MSSSRTISVEILGDASSIERAFRTTSTAGTRLRGDLSALASATVKTQAQSREALTQLAAEYQRVADSAKKGSDEQIAAARLAADANAKLARQTQVSADEQKAALVSLGAEAKGLQGTVGKLSSSMALWLGAPAAAAGIASAIHEAQKYAASMELLHTQAGASTAEVTRMTAALKAVGPSVGTGPAELATGLYHLESQGLRGAKALDTLRISAEGARIGNANLEDVTNALGAVVFENIRGTENYQHAMGVLNATVGAGDMRMQDLADAMGTGLPAAAATYGVSLKDVGAALAVFGDGNIRGAEAGTRLASAIRLLAAPSKVGAKELAGLGLSSTQLGDDLRNQGLVYAIEDLKTHMDAMGLSATQQGVVLTRAFGGRQAQGILMLINELDRLKMKEADVGKGGASFASDWEAYTQQSQFQTQKFEASLERLRIEVGTALLPEFTAATKELTAWLDRMEKSGAIERDSQIAAHELASAVHLLGTVIHDVDDITGGFEQTLEVLLGMKLASTLGLWSGSFTKLGTAAGMSGAEAQVVGLTGALKNLAALGVVTVSVDLLEHLIPSSVTTSGQNDLNRAGAGWLGHLPLVGSAAQAGAWTAQQIFGAGTASTATGEKTATYTTADLAAYQAGVAGKSYPLSKLTGSVLQAYIAGRNAGAHPFAAAGATTTATGGYEQMAATAAAQFGVPQQLFLAQIKQESGFDPNARSKVGAEGIAQFMPGTAKGYGINPWDPKQALPAAAKMMAGLYNEFGDWGLALAAYNAGPQAVKNYLAGKAPLPQETTAYVKAITGAPLGATYGSSRGTPSASQLAALGLAPGGASGKPKKPPVVSGAAEIPHTVGTAIDRYAALAKQATGAPALAYVQDEQKQLAAARDALKSKLADQTGKQAAATQHEIDALTKKIENPQIITGHTLLPQSLLDAIATAKNAATTSTGATAEKYLDNERALLVKARDDLQAELASATGKQRTAIHAELDQINTQIAGVSKSITTNLATQATEIKRNAQQAITQGRSAITSAFSNIVNDVKGAFETETQNYISTTLARQYLQGNDPTTGMPLQTPLEQQLSDMQAADTKQGLQASIDTAEKQLQLDQQTVGVSADQLAADQKAVDQAQRAYDENELSIEATRQRAQEDADYATAVAAYQKQRSDEEHSMLVALNQLGAGIANGTANIGGLNGILAQFGVSLADVPSDQLTSDMDTLSQATQDLADVFIAEAKALAKIGDSKDASAAAAAAAALGAQVGAGSPYGSSSAYQQATAAIDAATGNIHVKGAVPFASGGIVTRTTVAVIGEAGPEAVIPLDRLSGTGGAVELHVHVGQVVGTRLDKAAQELATPILRQLQEWQRRNGSRPILVTRTR